MLQCGLVALATTLLPTEAQKVNLYRYWSATDGDHLYTQYTDEIGTVAYLFYNGLLQYNTSNPMTISLIRNHH